MKQIKNTQNATANASSTAQKVTIITAENVQELANILAARALDTVHAKSGQAMFDDLRRQTWAGKRIIKTKNYTEIIPDGYDFVQEAALLLCGFLGRGLDEKITDENGNETTIIKFIFKSINALIIRERQKVYKEVYVEGIEGGYIRVPKNYSVDNAQDLQAYEDFITAAGLTAAEERVLRARLAGYAIGEIARRLGVTKDTAKRHLFNVQAKAAKIGGNIAKKAQEIINGGASAKLKKLIGID